ncbi:MAG: flavodoxin family protein [Paramuribaculum sp.]|nr:flavodoxin family protein [Paramuribaculum sp.]
MISTSLRGNSNSHRLAEEFARGATESGNEVELLTLHHKDIRFCIGCLSCVKTGKCVIKDDVPQIVRQRLSVLITRQLLLQKNVFLAEDVFTIARKKPGNIKGLNINL